jgi:alkanesulfonate monooxygenase SsuD/methylene tetrahydromethanopterin reductase-like flavin-dependent oxidoreductase (luciferase family)
MMFGGRAEQVIARVVKYGKGYVGSAGGTPESLRSMMERIREAWDSSGRSGFPESRAVVYFVLGDDAMSSARRSIDSYYGPPHYDSEAIWSSLVSKSTAGIERHLAAYAAVGCDELIFLLTSPTVEQVKRLADVVRPRM